MSTKEHTQSNGHLLITLLPARHASRCCIEWQDAFKKQPVKCEWCNWISAKIPFFFPPPSLFPSFLPPFHCLFSIYCEASTKNILMNLLDICSVL